MDKIEEILTRGVAEIVERKSLERKLRSGKKLRIKYGIDPTIEDLHLGYAVQLEKLRQLQKLGHQIIFLIGDFTARFGDPTQRLKTRPLRSKAEVKKLAKGYLSQVSKILDLKKTEVRSNSEWYDSMSAEEMLRLLSHFSCQRMLERDMFQERIKKGLEIRLQEICYPVLQGYDSVVLKSDLEVGGSDQLFNALRGRDLQKIYGQPPQDVLTLKILIGTDGRKMSQSLGNIISLKEKPDQMYGKIMSLPDQLIFDYFELVTRVPLTEIEKMKKEMKEKKVNPRDIKARLAREIVTIYHGPAQAKRAAREFERIFREKKLPSKIREVKIEKRKIPLIELLVKTELCPSRSEAKRLILQKAVKIDQKRIKDWKSKIQIKKGMVLQVGKRKFVKIS
jgi:tyrosyl-tRNA synthetase